MEYLAVEEAVGLDYFGNNYSGCSSSASIVDDDVIPWGWDDWAPVIDWCPLPVVVDNDFSGMMDWMLSGETDEDDYSSGLAVGGAVTSQEPSSACSALTSSPETPREEDDAKGLRLVHLLMAAAEALAGASGGRELARVILARLKELLASSAVSAGGANMERLAAHFTDALLELLDGPSAVAGGRHRPADDHHLRSSHHHSQPDDVVAAFQLLQDMSPYVKFGHFTANQAILEAAEGSRRLHIIDYDIMEGIQWASLMQALVSRKDGPPAPHLRITAVTRGAGSGGKRGGPMGGTVQEVGRRLAAFAASIGLPFSFGQCRLDADEKFRGSAVKLVKGEVLVANCILHLPHSPRRSSVSVASFLEGAAALGPKLVTLVEEEEEEETAASEEEGGFVGRFMATLHRYSAICDALEAGFPAQGTARGLVEKVFLGPKIASAVGRVFRGEKGGWGEWMAGMGFGRVGISFFNQCQSRLLLGLFNDGYRVEEEEANKLVLGWKSRRLLSASVWSPQSVSSPACGSSGSGCTSDIVNFC